MLIGYRQIKDQCAKESKKRLYEILREYFMGYIFPNGELDTQSIEYRVLSTKY